MQLQDGQKSLDGRKKAYIAILLLGLVSLMGDVVYEGSRGLVPGYLELLGASAFLISLVGGLGDFLGYVFRLAGGYLADATRSYWLFVFLGYGLIAAIPLLGLNLGLWAAIAFILLERLGKALRSPSRDTILSIVSREVGAGKAFGIHELLDQVGAILGPTLVSFLMLTTASIQATFSLLSIPFLALMAVLACTYKAVGQKAFPQERPQKTKPRRLPGSFYLYTMAVSANTIGLIPYTIILLQASRHLEPSGEMWILPLIYMLIQGVDAPAALASGLAYDRLGLKVLFAPFLLSLLPSLLVMGSPTYPSIWVSAIFFGLVLGMQESIYRAAVSRFTLPAAQGAAYGIFNAAYGVSLLISGAVYGLILDLKAPFTIVAAYAFAMQAAAMLLLLKANRRALKDTA